jgi:ABC-type Fe3+-siderophore transport system permease subunit
MEPIFDILFTHKTPAASRFFYFAPRYSLYVSSGAAIVACLSFVLFRFTSISITVESIEFFSAILFLAFLSSLLMGVASLFGIRRFGVRSILWRALVGIAVSSFFGFWSGVAWAFTQARFQC